MEPTSPFSRWEMKCPGTTGGTLRKAPTLSRRWKSSISRGRGVADAVAVAGQEHLLVLDVLAHRQQPLADVGVQPGVDEGDPPVVDVAGQQLEAAAAVREHEVVGVGLVVVEEVPLEPSAL